MQLRLQHHEVRPQRLQQQRQHQKNTRGNRRINSQAGKYPLPEAEVSLVNRSHTAHQWYLSTKTCSRNLFYLAGVDTRSKSRTRKHTTCAIQ